MSVTKTCQQCSGVFERKPSLSNAQWLKARFCCRRCAVQWRAIHEPRPVATGPCADCGEHVEGLKTGRCLPCYGRARYRAKREHILENNRKWREANPDYFKQPHLVERAIRTNMRLYHGDLELHQAVLERDDYTCQTCGKQAPNQRGRDGVCVHHIDGDRKNAVAENMVVLCNPCHTRLHAKQGDYFGRREAA